MHQAIFADEFKKQLKKLKKKDNVMYNRLVKKIKNVLNEPTHLKHLKNMLKGKQRVHLGHFVLKFEVKEDIVYFITFKHHDIAY
ncbi:MAG: type II toxin-antitoxin system RelE/ParE family toxin [Nanoarchaeota archaeon]|nr:type II toxin-antitoxin system RelE/ParE family toxin [Nanoarchaeota archaeon]